MKIIALTFLFCSSLLAMDTIQKVTPEAQLVAAEVFLKRCWHSIEKNDFELLEAILIPHSDAKNTEIKGAACLYLGAIYTRPPCWDPPQASRYLLAAKKCDIGLHGEAHADELLEYIESQLNSE